MTYPYFEATSQIKRPIIPLFLKSQTRIIFYAGLIDSGADYCIFGLDIANSLEIDLKSKNKVKFIGAGGEKVKGFWGTIELRINSRFYEAKVIFAEIADFGHGILGQQGFFDHFDVKLSYQKQTIEIEPIKTSN